MTIWRIAMLINKENSLLLIIDVQENLTPVQESPREVINGCMTLLEVAEELKIPYIVAEQDHKVFGSTMIDLRKVMKNKNCYYEKDTFSCCKNAKIRETVEKIGKKQIIIAGLETHLCVLQTAIDFHEAGYEVFVVADSCSSRSSYQNSMGIQRLIQHGIDVVTREMVLFEWMDKSGSKLFDELWKHRLR